MGMFDDMCMVTGLPIFQHPAVVFLLHRDVGGAPWRLLGGPIVGKRDAYGRLEELLHEVPERWMISNILRTFSGVQPQHSYMDGWLVPEATAEGLSSFVNFALSGTRAAQSSDGHFPKYRYGEFACAAMLASVYEAVLAEAPLVVPGDTAIPDLVPPQKARDVGRLSLWLTRNRIPWKPLTSWQTIEDEQVQAFLGARGRWCNSELMSKVVEDFLDDHEWAWERGYR